MNLIGIETNLTNTFNSTIHSYNWTLSELKRFINIIYWSMKRSYNWTLSELKRSMIYTNADGYMSYNWTLSELKRIRFYFFLLFILVIIEPYRNWNRYMMTAVQSAWRVIIEPYRNWNMLGHHGSAPVSGYNWTLSELKQSQSTTYKRILRSYNWTLSELKLCFLRFPRRVYVL